MFLGVRRVLHWYYRVVSKVLQWCYIDVTRVVVGCYRGVKGVKKGYYRSFTLFIGSYIGVTCVTGVLYECFRGVTGVLQGEQGFYRGVTLILQICYMAVKRFFRFVTGVSQMS